LALETVKIAGINIQWPWSEYILSGKKTIETRSYPIPKKHIGNPLAVIETPGKLKKGQKARIIGIVVFKSDIIYTSKKHWKGDKGKHLVIEGDALFNFSPNKPKYGWIIDRFISFKHLEALPRTRGIVFANNCEVPKVAYDKLMKSYT
jgi:hypothetical protein